MSARKVQADGFIAEVDDEEFKVISFVCMAIQTKINPKSSNYQELLKQNECLSQSVFAENKVPIHMWRKGYLDFLKYLYILTYFSGREKIFFIDPTNSLLSDRKTFSLISINMQFKLCVEYMSKPLVKNLFQGFSAVQHKDNKEIFVFETMEGN